MATYIGITRSGSTAAEWIYDFACSVRSTGVVRVAKASGSARVTRPCLCERADLHGACVVRKLEAHFREGEMPERTCWAS